LKLHQWEILELFGPLVLLPIVWETGVVLLDIPTALLPRPSALIINFADNIDLYIKHSRSTVSIILAGFVLGSLTGNVAGIFVYHIDFFRETVYPILTTFAIVPKIAFAPALVIWLGVGWTSAIALIVLIVFFPVMINTFTGLYGVDDEYVDMIRIYNDSELFILWKLRLPKAAPQLVSGWKLGIIFSVIGAIVAEFLGSSVGLGYFIVKSANFVQTVDVFTSILVVAGIVVILYGSLTVITNRIVYW